MPCGGRRVLFVCALKQALNGYPKDLRKPIELNISYAGVDDVVVVALSDSAHGAALSAGAAADASVTNNTTSSTPAPALIAAPALVPAPWVLSPRANDQKNSAGSSGAVFLWVCSMQTANSHPPPWGPYAWPSKTPPGWATAMWAASTCSWGWPVRSSARRLWPCAGRGQKI